MKCLIFICVLTYVTVAIRVPSSWDDAEDNKSYKRHRFRRLEPHRPAEQTIGTDFNQKAINLQHNGWVPLPSAPESNFVSPNQLVLNQNKLFLFPQKSKTAYQNTIPFGARVNQRNIQDHRRSDTIKYQKENDVNIVVPKNKRPYQRNPELLTSYLQPLRQEEYDNLRQPVLNQLTQRQQNSPSLHFDSSQVIRNTGPFVQNRKFQKPHGYTSNSKYTVLALDPNERKPLTVKAESYSPLVSVSENQKPVGYTTKKEPIFFVTEGYRNVLIQGPNKMKYESPDYQNKEESKISTGSVLTDDNHGQEDRPTHKRRVTKIYKVHGPTNHQDAENDVEETPQRALIESRRLFRPQEQTDEQDDDRRARLRSHLTKNYRDDKVHEPENDKDDQKDDKDDRIKEESEKDDNTEDDDAKDEETDEEKRNDADPEEKPVPHSEHADPKPVPTKPIYPGEGLWAKPGVKHRPFVYEHKFVKPEDDAEADKPEGHDVFEDLERFFKKQRASFGDGLDYTPSSLSISNNIKSVNPVNPIIVYNPFEESTKQITTNQIPANHKPEQIPESSKVESSTNNEEKQETDNEESTQELNNKDEEGEDNKDKENEELEENDEDQEDDDEESDDENDFVPLQLYTQVRKHENEEHLPSDPIENGRLREVIKDSKIQTVYTEEGYEDTAYDHAGHEKKAEEDEGYSEFEKEKEGDNNIKPIKEKDSDKVYSNKVVATANLSSVTEPIDSLPADSIYPSVPKNSVSTHNMKDSFMDSGAKNVEPNKIGNTNNFITTQELKTTAVKENKRGNVQMEIQSEVKVIVQPNNSTKAHRYVKIYPKVLKEVVNEPVEPEQVDETTFDDTDDLVTEKISKQSMIEDHVRQGENIATVSATEKVNAKTDDLNPENVAATNNSGKNPTSTEELPDLKQNMSDLTTLTTSYTSSSAPPATVVVRVLDDDNEPLSKINAQFLKISGLRRKKRSSGSGFEDVKIDIGFIDKINHTLPKKKGLDTEKYPYYKLPGLNKDSPLRYAENMKNIPVKIEGELSFYNQADRYECPELVKNIDPIPEHVKNAGQKQEEEENDDENDEGDEEGDGVDKKQPVTPKTPRIQLGDKIDCLKARYFGKNPLDSPIFREDTVGPVIPIFKELERKSKSNFKDHAIKESQVVRNVNRVNQIFDNNDKKGIVVIKNKEPVVKNAIYQNTINQLETINAESIRSTTKVGKPSQNIVKPPPEDGKPTPLPIVSLITTPKYTIQLTPKNIYDQITLLDHLPENEDVNVVQKSKKESVEQENRDTPTSDKDINISRRNDDEEIISIRNPKVLIQENEDSADSSTIEPQPLRRRIRPRIPMFQIFDINRFITTTPFTIINPVQSTVLPKYKVISEVFYKDDIKPNEQLNVFADVINNIKNNTNAELLQLQSSSNFAEPSSVTISTLRDANNVAHGIRVKKYQIDSSNRNHVVSTTMNPQVATERPYRPNYPESYVEQHHKTHNLDNVLISNTKIGNQNENTKRVLKRRRKPTVSTTSTIRSTTQGFQKSSTPLVIDTIENTEVVIGLVPPENWKYKTIVEDSDVRESIGVPENVYEYRTILPSTVTEAGQSPAPVSEETDEIPAVRSINRYYFLGLKPPPSKQKAHPYSEYIDSKNVVRRRVGTGHFRPKRSANRPSYSELSRNRGKQEEILEKVAIPQDDADDYVPHRPKNYHYDEKTGRIVYDKKPKPIESEEEEVEVVEIEDPKGIYLERAEDATHPSAKAVTANNLLATATPPPEGKSFVDFLNTLRADPSYKLIPDPTTTERDSAPATTEASLTIDPKSTNPPEFLNILAKVRSDSNYKLIEDSKDDNVKSKVTTEAPKQEEEVEAEKEQEESQQENVQNSPGGQNIGLSNFQIFDIGEYLPKIKNFAPKTSIDYSKYKTIERPSTRHNISSRYNSEGEKNLDEVATVRNPLIMEEKESVQSPVISKNRFEEKQSESSTKAAVLSSTVLSRRGTRPTTKRSSTFEAQGPETTKKSPSRRRQRPTTSRSTTEVSEATEVVERVFSPNDKAKRVYRRRPVRIRHTTERQEEDDDAVAKIVRRSSDSEIGDVQNSFDYAEESEDEEIEENEEEQIEKIDRVVDENIDDLEKGSESINTSVEKKVEGVEVLKEYDESKKHGGNYRREHEEQNDNVGIEDSLAVQRQEKAIDLGDKNKYSENVVSNGKKQQNIEVFKDYDKTKKHGGNYRKEEDSKTSKVIDKENVHKENESSASIVGLKKLDVDTFKKYDQSKKHGGNYRTEEDSKIVDKRDDSIKENVKSAGIVKLRKVDVAVIKKYDENKKTGGNYHSEEDSETDEVAEKIVDEGEDSLKENIKSASINRLRKLDVDLNKEYDKTNKHGGNYEREEDSDIEESDKEAVKKYKSNENEKSASINRPRKLDVDVVKKYDQTNKHGGGYKSEEDAVLDELLEKSPDVEVQVAQSTKFVGQESGRESPEKKREINVNSQKRRRIRIRPKHVVESSSTESTKIVKKLTDVVPKPEHFYSDPKLPKQVNQLGNDKIQQKINSAELEEIIDNGDDERDEEVSKDTSQRRNDNLDVDDDTVDLEDEKDENGEEEEKYVPTEKPLFIKDPSKRLYFYAPV